MQKRLAAVLLAAATTGCGAMHASFVKVDEVSLGRVVIYRNGVAFYERRATVSGGGLTVSVPRDRVDDFLKSLTVVDARSREPLPVAIPRQQSEDGPNLVMKLELPSTDTADVVLTYVTEAPAWKPSYRVVVGDHHDVMLEGWAIVDNTSGEDWKHVYVGVGSSSALSFRYDLWSVRQVQRETLENEERFAVAPPTGVSPYGGAASAGGGDVVLSELGDDEIRRPAGHPGDAQATRLATRDAEPTKSDEEFARVAQAQGEAIVIEGRAPMIDKTTTTAPTTVIEGDLLQKSPSPPRPIARARHSVAKAAAPVVPDGRVAAGDEKVKQLSKDLIHSDKAIVIEGYAHTADAEASRRATDRANIVRTQLIDQGVAPARIQIVTKVDAARPEGVRLVAQAARNEPKGSARSVGNRAAEVDAQPVGESHFENKHPMTVDRGSSAMVSMVRQVTEGEQVYLYDAESERGNARFAFRAVRFKNPTDSTLEAGPMTVYGNERFIGEGLTEPIPPHASAVVPFALDRQIVVDESESSDDRIARLATLQRGILTAEVQHIRRRHFKLTNRLPQVARVFVRHTVTKGWSLVDTPQAFERVGDAHLFEVQLAPGETRDVLISEATPIESTLDLSADATLEMMKVWIDAPQATRELKDQVHRLLGAHKAVADLLEEKASIRRRLADYRQRMDELHAQIVSLQLVRTGGELMGHLKTKMKEISDRVQRATIQLVDQEEKIMLARVRFQDALADLTLPEAGPVASASPAAPPAGTVQH